ncbi:hypothetical protein NADE_002583 [Nannochloris sp. 'desiccata']|nr:hypothetical protein NADE_002583 [Chlorella desiccata (nom. nud.)]
MWYQLCTPIWRPKDLGFATAGSALAPFYYYGVMETLISSKILNQKTAPVGGLSGGAVVSLAVCGGVAPTLMQNASALAISQCLTSWNKTTQSIPCQGELTTLVVSLTQIVFPLNSTKFQKKCAGRIRIAMTKLNASDATMSSLSPYVRTKFVGTELYDAVAATAMIPCMSTCKPYTLFKGIPVVDGGFSATFKELCPPNVKRCITTQEYYPGKYVKAGGGECLKNGNDPVASGGEYECTMSVPSGFKFAPRGNLLTSCPTGSKYFQPPGFSDLYPGMHKENPLPYTCSEWQNFSYFPQDDSFQTQFDAGKKDAFIWGQNEGLIP